MLKHYLTLALKVLWRRKFFTFISLFGISFTLMVLTVITAMFDHAFGPGAPEPRLNRTLFADHAVMYGPHSTWSSSAGLQAVRQVRAEPAGSRAAVDLPGAEDRRILRRWQEDQVGIEADRRRILAHTRLHLCRGRSFRHGRCEPGAVRRRDQCHHPAAFLRRTGCDWPDAGSRRAAVQSRRRRRNVSELRGAPFADIWVPYTTAKTDAYKREVMGDWRAMALARDEAAMAAIHDEFNSRLLRVELPDPKRTRRSWHHSRPSSRDSHVRCRRHRGRIRSVRCPGSSVPSPASACCSS